MAQTQSQGDHIEINVESLDHTETNVESLVSSFRNMMADNLSMSDNCCIFRTPKILHRHNEKAYEPNTFSIGPFHHEKEQLKQTQKIKLKYLQGILHRSARPEERVERLRQFIEAIRAVEAEAREYYAGTIDINNEDFLKILVLDGCFIIELFRKDAEEVPRDPDDPIFNMSCLLEVLNHDLILLENQIPWLVLERLYNLTTVPGNNKPLVQLALEFFGNIFSSREHPVTTNQFENTKIKHVLDLLRNSLLLPLGVKDQERNAQQLGWQPFPSATILKESGIKFERAASCSVLNIRFRNGVLEIPSLLIQETTETIFRNLISYEQCHPNCRPIITSYAKLMDCLIDTTKDMEMLCKKNIFDNWVSPEVATKFFNSLYTDAFLKEFYYHELCEQVNSHREHSWPRLRYCYMHYFTSPWAIVSQFVAAIILILTFLQTLYSIKK